ncbi:hypothetical protein C6P46_004683 [Rhodotorula mucilaginosa]|uniref:Uncharacterized protein n=1 Tax=Rhodotorula mucilaginosa TaxID=5537 RepID=A0A9P6W215_RHOMI|nr:hypothetical protein C6P46_004683 [Rhodotorula mucilaginosa]
MAFQVSASSVSTEAFRTLLVDPKADLSSDPPQGGAPRRPTAYLSFDVRTICSGHCCSADIRSLELRDCTGRGRRCGSNESGFLCRIASERTRALDSSLKMASLREAELRMEHSGEVMRRTTASMRSEISAPPPSSSLPFLAIDLSWHDNNRLFVQAYAPCRAARYKSVILERLGDHNERRRALPSCRAGVDELSRSKLGGELVPVPIQLSLRGGAPHVRSENAELGSPNAVIFASSPFSQSALLAGRVHKWLLRASVLAGM